MIKIQRLEAKISPKHNTLLRFSLFTSHSAELQYSKPTSATRHSYPADTAIETGRLNSRSDHGIQEF